MAEKTGIELIAAERERQVSQEGWTPEHDDAHTDQNLARAAACYAYPGRLGLISVDGQTTTAWPWRAQDDKRARFSRIRCLVVAGALIAAEIDRLNRTEG